MNKTLTDEFLTSMDRIRKMFFYSKMTFPIPHGEFATLSAIVTLSEDNIKATTSTLSELLSISKPAVSQSINSLEKKNLVKREIDANDKRIYCLSLTDEGTEKMQKFYSKCSKILEVLLSRLGEDDARQFVTLINKTHGVIKDMINDNEFKQELIF